MIELGIGHASHVESWRTAQRAEELGFSHMWLYDSPMLYGDVFVAMALAARETSRIRLSPGVLVPSNRIAPVTAGALATLSKLAPGRIELAVGTGGTSRATMDIKRPMTLADLRHHVEIVRGLLSGDTVQWRQHDAVRRVRFIEQDEEFVALQHTIPIHISALGPKGHALAAEVGDGWATVGTTPVLLAQAQLMDATREGLGARRDLYRSAHTAGCVLDDDEPADGGRAMAEAGPQVAAFLHGCVEGWLPTPPGLEELVQTYRQVVAGHPEDERHLHIHKGHYRYLRDEDLPFVTAELIKAFTFTGTRSELAEQIDALDDAGFDHLSITIPHGHEGALDRWAALHRHVYGPGRLAKTDG